jgi:hypothetical protein
MTYLIEQHKGRGRWATVEQFEDSALAEKEFDLLTTGPNGELRGMYRLRNVKTTRQLLQDEHEREVAQMETAERMLTVLKRIDGKKLTRRVLKPIAELIGQECFLNQDYGLVSLNTMDYVRGNYESGSAVHLTIPTALGDTTLPVVDVEQIRERNAAYFSAAAERNAIRWERLESDWPEQVDAAGAAYRAAKAAFKQLTAYPCPDSCRISKLQEVD